MPAAKLRGALITLAFEVGSLWHDPLEGDTFSGWLKLPWPLPAGGGIRAILIPQPLRGRKEKFIVHLEMPLIEAKKLPETGTDDITIKGERMSQWFKPPKPSNRRHKILIWGLSGSAKTKSALEFPQAAYIDNHGSAEKYEAAYPQHLFFGSASEPPTPDNTMAATTSLLGDPGDRRTLVLDDITTYWDQVQGKWSKLFLSRLPKSPGHHAEFYTFQPSDWQHPKRELRSLIRRMIALDMNVIVIARAQKEYAGEGGNFMKVIGEIFAGEKNLVYEFDYVFRLVHEGGKYQAVVDKQRITPGEKPLPETFNFTIDKKGRSTFYDEFCKYVDKKRLTQAPHQVADPVTETGPAEPVTETGPKTIIGQPKELEKIKDADPQPGPQPDPAPEYPVPEATGATAAINPEIMITQNQLDQLVALKEKFKIQKAEWDATLQKNYNATTARTLTQEQGEHFINYLEKIRTPF